MTQSIECATRSYFNQHTGDKSVSPGLFDLCDGNSAYVWLLGASYVADTRRVCVCVLVGDIRTPGAHLQALVARVFLQKRKTNSNTRQHVLLRRQPQHQSIARVSAR